MLQEPVVQALQRLSKRYPSICPALLKPLLHNQSYYCTTQTSTRPMA